MLNSTPKMRNRITILSFNHFLAVHTENYKNAIYLIDKKPIQEP